MADLQKDDFEKRSEAFFQKVKPPTTENLLIKNLDIKEKLFKFADEAYPLIHTDVVDLAQKFLENKRHCGNGREKQIYEDMSLENFITRLLKKRPLMFINSDDSWMDKDNKTGRGKWDPNLDKFLSYDEIKISALIQLSTQTSLINDGNRNNKGGKMRPGTFISEAVYVAAVGARFEKPGVMEHQDIVQSMDQTRHDGMHVLEDYYKAHETDEKNERVGRGLFFNTSRYKQRMRISFDTFLLEANKRGKDQGKEVYCHVVGLGMGVWQLPGFFQQNRYWFEAFEESLRGLVNNNMLDHITDIDFSWVRPDTNDVFKDEGFFPRETRQIKIHVSKREPFQLLQDKDKEKLVVAMFAWDGNAYVGNEYWAEMLSTSGDPAAACCSFIPELLNPDINLNISGDNLHVACPKNGILSYKEFKTRISSTGVTTAGATTSVVPTEVTSSGFANTESPTYGVASAGASTGAVDAGVAAANAKL